MDYEQYGIELKKQVFTRKPDGSLSSHYEDKTKEELENELLIYIEQKKKEVSESINSKYSDSDQKNMGRKFALAFFDTADAAHKQRMMTKYPELIAEISEANEFIESEIAKV